MPPEEASSHGETVNLSAPSSVDEGPVINADTRSFESVRDSGRLKSGTSEYYHSVQRWQLKRAVEEAGTDTVTVLQGVFMEFGVERLSTAQETLLLHTMYKAMVSWIENT